MQFMQYVFIVLVLLSILTLLFYAEIREQPFQYVGRLAIILLVNAILLNISILLIRKRKALARTVTVAFWAISIPLDELPLHLAPSSIDMFTRMLYIVLIAVVIYMLTGIPAKKYLNK